MEILGSILVVVGIIFPTWWINNQLKHKTAKEYHVRGIIAICLITVVAGFCLIFRDRITEITINNVGTIRTTIQADAETVSQLRKRVESQSATVDLVAKEASQAKIISEEVANKNQKAEEKLDSLNKAIEAANVSLANLESLREFTLTSMAAQNDDRVAFEKLIGWSRNSSYSLQNQALQTALTIEGGYVGFLGERAFMELKWKDDVDPTMMSMEQVWANWRKLHFRSAPAYVEFVWNHTFINKEQKLSFLYSVLGDSRGSLQAADLAAKKLSAEAKLKYNTPFNFSAIDKWWKEREALNNLGNEETPITNVDVQPYSSSAMGQEKGQKKRHLPIKSISP